MKHSLTLLCSRYGISLNTAIVWMIEDALAKDELPVPRAKKFR